MLIGISCEEGSATLIKLALSLRENAGHFARALAIIQGGIFGLQDRILDLMHGKTAIVDTKP